MASERKKVLLFGATGELGSRVAHCCVDSGHHVTGVTRGKNTGTGCIGVDLSAVEFLTGDKGDENCLKKLADEKKFDVVIDIVPTTEHLELAFKYFAGKIEHYFLCSSTGTYVPLLYYPADEEHPWRQKTPVNFFPQCLRDARALQLWEQNNFPVTIFRPTNIIGPGRIPLELWGGRNILYWKLMKENKHLEIPLNGKILLQSGYNDDLAAAFAAAVSKGPEISGEIYIISSSKAVTLDTYFEVAKDFLKSKSPLEYIPIDEIIERRGKEVSRVGIEFLVEHMCFDITKARHHLAYEPKVTPQQGLINALKWCTQQGLL